jgi:hypothetical protein
MAVRATQGTDYWYSVLQHDACAKLGQGGTLEAVTVATEIAHVGYVTHLLSSLLQLASLVVQQ